MVYFWNYLGVAGIGMLIALGSVQAGTINVPDDYETLQDAVDSASSGDVIMVDPGVYTGTGDYVVDLRGKALTLQATGAVADTVIHGEGERRCLYCRENGVDELTVRGFTITGGAATSGAGCPIVDSSFVLIEDCVIQGNAASDSGGGVYIESAAPTLRNCTIKNNSAEAHGGGIRCINEAHALVESCLI